MFRFRRPPQPQPQPTRPIPVAEIRFIDEPGPAIPKRDAAVAVAKAPRRDREWPIGTMAFLVVIGSGLVLRTAGFPGGGRAQVKDEVTRTFAVSEAPRIVVDTFNGPIEIDRGGTGTIDCVVTRWSSGIDDAEARAHLKNISVVMTQELGAVHVNARRIGMSWDAGASVRIHVPEGAAVTLKTSNGPITVTGVEGPVAAHATNGHVRVQGAMGAVVLTTTNGRIACDATDAIVSAGSTNGPIEFRGSLALGRSSFLTTNGRVTLKLPEALAFRLDARTTNGKVSSDFDVEGESDRKSKRLVGTVGHFPKVDVKVRTTNGNIRIVEED